MTRRIVVGISGATGIAYALAALELARKAGCETHLVVTPAGQQTRAHETDLSAADLAAMADVSYLPADVGAAIASGSFRTCGMIVAPCSVRSLSAIAYSLGDNLLTRAADVTLKERRAPAPLFENITGIENGFRVLAAPGGRPGGVRGDTQDMHPPGTDLRHEEHVQTLEEHGVNMQEVTRQDPGCL